MAGRQEVKSPGYRIVHFGKHNGKRYGEVPTQYLQWMIAQAFEGQAIKQGQEPARIRWAKEELTRRLKPSL